MPDPLPAEVRIMRHFLCFRQLGRRLLAFCDGSKHSTSYVWREVTDLPTG